MEKLLGQVLWSGYTLVVVPLDRLGRSLRHLLEVVGSLTAAGVALRSLHGSIDTTTAAGLMVLQVFGALAEFERELIRERTLAGLAAARARGRVGGRPPTPGRTPTEVAALLRVSRATVYRRLADHRASA